MLRDSPARKSRTMQNKDLACPHERKRLTGRNLSPLKKQSPTKLPNWNKGRRRRGGGLVLPINYGRAD
jgi:hypothetical protein